MCFDQRTSFMFAGVAFLGTFVLYRVSGRKEPAICFFYFFLMEFLQGFQYMWINECDNPINQFLTFLGYLHICFQPFFSNLGILSMMNPKQKGQHTAVLKLSILAGVCMLLKYLLVPYLSDIYPWPEYGPGPCERSEWMAGDKLCTRDGNVHLAWEVPLLPASYYIPGLFLHLFMMFGPLLVLSAPHAWIAGAVLFFFGPIVGSYITTNMCEQPAIWCFFSVSQICIMAIWLLGVQSKIVPWDMFVAKKAANAKKTN